MSNRAIPVAIELRLPVALGADAIKERALSLGQSGFRWDASTTLRTQAGGRDELGSDNPTDRTVLLQGWTDNQGLDLLENEPDVVAIWKVENEWWDKLVVDKRKR